MQISRFLHIERRPANAGATWRAVFYTVIMLLLVFCGQPAAADDGWDDWGDSGSSEPKVRRPFISGWWNWQYNEFSSFDQGRVTFEKELGNGSKLVTGGRVNYYTEDNKEVESVSGRKLLFLQGRRLRFQGRSSGRKPGQRRQVLVCRQDQFALFP